MRRGQRLAEARGRPAQAVALGRELGMARLELVRHVVERAAERGELVVAAHGDPLGEPPAGDRMGRLGQGAQRAHDRAALEVRDERDERERGEQPDQQAVAPAAVRVVDQRLRAEDREADLRNVADHRRDERSPADAGDVDRLRAARCQRY